MTCGGSSRQGKGGIGGREGSGHSCCLHNFGAVDGGGGGSGVVKGDGSARRDGVNGSGGSLTGVSGYRSPPSTTCQLHRANYLLCCNRLDCIRIGLLRYAIIFTQTSPKRTTSDDLISLKQEAASQRGKAQVCRTKVTDRTDAVTEASQQSPTNSRRTKHTEQHARATSLLDLVVLWHRPIHLLSEQRAGGQQRGVARR